MPYGSVLSYLPSESYFSSSMVAKARKQSTAGSMGMMYDRPPVRLTEAPSLVMPAPPATLQQLERDWNQLLDPKMQMLYVELVRGAAVMASIKSQLAGMAIVTQG
mmetsp:Transcript_6218/g.11962  ORF Transcript_6218/g.11962 Transcript_6218/m.11962 type:complete len:105 (+) Transcript_6218:1685-1999(+)